MTPAERARIAAAYNCTVPETVTVTHCPRGASGETPLRWDGHKLVLVTGSRTWNDIHKARLWSSRRRHDPVVAERRARLRDLVEAGRTMREIRAALGISFKLIYNDLKALGVPCKMVARETGPTLCLSDARAAAWHDLHDRILAAPPGLSYSALARHVGTTRNTVKQHLLWAQELGEIDAFAAE